MDVQAYTPADLELFQQALEQATELAQSRGLDTPVELMAKRLFLAAEQGLRDIETLKAVALGDEAWPPTGPDAKGPIIDPSTLAPRSGA